MISGINPLQRSREQRGFAMVLTHVAVVTNVQNVPAYFFSIFFKLSIPSIMF